MSEPSTSEEPIYCFNCTLQVQRIVYIECAECPVNICIPCFQCGAESGKHVRGHAYFVKDPKETNQQSSRRSYTEECRLLKAAHQFKMGNWGEIVESLGNDREDSVEVQEYFDKYFVRGWIGQLALKATDWNRLKYNLYRSGRMKSMVNADFGDSYERLLLIRDALIDSNVDFDENDPKLMTKVQNILSEYILKCINEEVSCSYEKSKVFSSGIETELSYDELDETCLDEDEKKVKKEPVEGEDSSANSQLKKVPSKRRRVTREASSDSEQDLKLETHKELDEEKGLHGLDIEDDDEEEEEEEEAESGQDVAETEDDEGGEEEGEEDEEVAKKKGRRRRKRKPWSCRKKKRRLSAYKLKMNKDKKRMAQEIAELNDICTFDELQQLRNEFPNQMLETGKSVNVDKSNFRVDDLEMIGYNVDREEFEYEWFNDAEMLISRLYINVAPEEKDHLLDIENDIKFARIQQYLRVLGMRKACRRAVIEHEKIGEFFNFMKAMTVEKRTAMEVIEDKTEVEKLLIATQQFLTRNEFKELSERLEKVDALRERITHLQELQKNGETTLKNALPCSVMRKSRKKKRKVDKQHDQKVLKEWMKYKRWHTSAVSQ